MSDHNFTARVWASAALVGVPLVGLSNVEWWLPLHLALLGAVTQAIVGGQLMFSATLGLSRAPSRRTTLTQLSLLNIGATLVIGGRAWNSRITFALGVTTITLVIGWVMWMVDRLWRGSINHRFAITGTSYRLAGASIFIGATIGGALGIGAIGDASHFVAYRSVHMTLNVFGWVGLTVVGTVITLLPTILHVRAPAVGNLRPMPWLMSGGLTLFAIGGILDRIWLSTMGMASYGMGLATLGVYMRRILATPRRRKIPTAALHLIAALVWLSLTTVAVVGSSLAGNAAAMQDFIVLGGAVGFAFQVLLGAWSFLLPSTREPLPKRRRLELVAMELGGRVQVVAYNLGVTAVLIGLRSDLDIELWGTVVAWAAATWALLKSWMFPVIAGMRSVHNKSAQWWAAPEKTP